MNNNLIVKLDLNDIDTYEKFIDKLNDAFEFVDWFGKNTSATIDCLSSIYFGEEQALAKIRNDYDSETILELSLYPCNKEILVYIINLISSINARLKFLKFNGRFSFRPIIKVLM